MRQTALGACGGGGFALLGLAERGVVGGRKLLPEAGVVDQVAHLALLGDERRSVAPCLRLRIAEVGQHPLLLDGPDAVREAAAGIAQVEDRLLHVEDALRVAAAERGFLAEAAAEVRHGLRDRVLALLEPGLLAKQ